MLSLRTPRLAAKSVVGKAIALRLAPRGSRARIAPSLVGLVVLLAGTAWALAPTAAAADPGPAEALTARAAFAASRKSGHAVEILAHKTATTRVWANPDGHATAEIYAVPVRLKRDGRWVDFDLTLAKRPDGTIAPKVHP